MITWFPAEVILRNEPKLSGADSSLTVADLHRHGQIRHEAVEPIARHTVWRPKGGSPCDGCRYDLIIGAAIAFFLVIIAVVALV